MNVELPRTQFIYSDYMPRLVVKTIWPFDNLTTIKYYARQYSYPHYQDVGYAAWSAYRITGGLPLNYVIDTAGIVVGEMENFNESTIRSWIESSLPPIGIAENTYQVQSIQNLSVAPNPAKNLTSIRFILQKSEDVSARVYSSSGKLVKTLFDGKLPAGNNSFNWNLRDDAGYRVANGIYLYELITEAGSARTKISVLR